MARILVADLGNTTLFAGVFSGSRWVQRFRVPANEASSAKGFARLVAPRLRGRYDASAVCSVRPDDTASLCRRLAKASGVEPKVLSYATSGVKTDYRRPSELGADRLACALGAAALHPSQDLVVVDCGTATTVTAINREGRLVGGAILPGVGLWSDMLACRTARLPAVSLRKPSAATGRSTQEALRSGILIGHAGAIRELTQRIGAEAFGSAGSPVVIGTGGNAHLLSQENLFTVLVPDLILTGLLRFAAPSAFHA